MDARQSGERRFDAPRRLGAHHVLAERTQRNGAEKAQSDDARCPLKFHVWSFSPPRRGLELETKACRRSAARPLETLPFDLCIARPWSVIFRSGPASILV